MTLELAMGACLRLAGFLCSVHLMLAVSLQGSDASPIRLQEEFQEPSAEWKPWSPREEISPLFRHDPEKGRENPGSLLIEAGDHPASFGAWTLTTTNFTPGSNFRFIAWYRTENVDNDLRSVIPRLDWKNAEGHQVRPPEFALGVPQEDGWSRVDYAAEIPHNARQLEIQLGFGFAPNGRVWWDDVRLKEELSLSSRKVRVATIHHRPRNTQTAEDNIRQFTALIDQAAERKPDIICLPEGITVVGNPLNYIDVSESIPGPTTRLLGKSARQHECYIVAGIYERDDDVVYNTAVLLDRSGKVAGKYRKTHLPREEWEAGLTPGNEYPVFKTDFGTVGLMICWDVQFPEPARAMALKGAELLLLPIWGGSDVLTRARSIENHVFLVSSTYDMRSFVVDPTGEVIAEATDENPIAVAEIDLERRYLQPWLGDMQHRTWKERRPDILVE